MTLVSKPHLWISMKLWGGTIKLPFNPDLPPASRCKQHNNHILLQVHHHSVEAAARHHSMIVWLHTREGVLLNLHQIWILLSPPSLFTMRGYARGSDMKHPCWEEERRTIILQASPFYYWHSHARDIYDLSDHTFEWPRPSKTRTINGSGCNDDDYRFCDGV